jgi:hypothetical protein
VADLLGLTNVRMLAEVYRHRVGPVADVTATLARMLGGGR